MKKFNELTEDEIIEDALRAIPEYLERIRTTGVFQLESCVAAETKRIEKLYKAGIGIRQYSPLSKKELQDKDAFTAHFIPLLMERTLPIQQRYMRQRRVSQINATTAQALIPAEFKKVGLKAEVSGQKYRAKVIVPLTGTSVRFYVRYKDMNREGLIDDIIKAVLDLKDAIDRLGYGCVVSKI